MLDKGKLVDEASEKSKMNIASSAYMIQSTI